MRAIRSGTAFVLLTLTAAACTQAPMPERPAPEVVVDTVMVVDTVVVETEAAADAQLEAQVGRLQLQLLERNTQVADLQQQLDLARQEVVRNMAKLQSQASRAEAASGISEAEIALQTLGRAEGGQELPEYQRAQALVAESSAEFNGENYGGALYLASQARTMARSGQARVQSGASSELRAGEELFGIPVPLKTVQRSNVRGGPGLNNSVLFTLDPDAALIGQSYTSQWVRIVDGEGREGWIFHTLVTGR